MAKPAVRILLLVTALIGLCLATLFAAMRNSSAAASASAKTSASVPASPTAATNPAPQAQPFTHTVLRGQGVPAVAHEYLSHTPYMTVGELEAAISQTNSLAKNARLHPGQTLIIPEYQPQLLVEHSVPVPRNYEVRAIYLTGLMAGSEHGLRIIRQWHDLGGNSVVFDIKDSDGILSIPFDHALAPHIKHPYISNLPKLIHYLHSLHMHAIARMALFRDAHIATEYPQLAVQSRRALAAAGGKGVHPWLEHNKQVWTDTSNPEVQAYNLALAKYVASLGADEIQFDYVRFPAESDQADAQFAFMTAHPQWTRADVIADFLERAYKEIHPTGVLLSLDVFGVMAWQRPADLKHTGQDIPRMARFCDVLSPMIYPSHFFGMDGYAQPGDAPEHFIGESMKRFIAATQGSGVVIRPWLQAFAWRTKTYSPQYIETQVRVAKDNSGIGFLFWNARNDYSRPYAAMPVMTANSAIYFQPLASTAPATAKTAALSQTKILATGN